MNMNYCIELTDLCVQLRKRQYTHPHHGNKSRKLTVTSLGERILSRKFPYRAGIFKRSTGARHRIGIGLLYRPARLHRLAEFIPWNWFRGPHIRSKIPAQYFRLATVTSETVSNVVFSAPKNKEKLDFFPYFIQWRHQGVLKTQNCISHEWKNINLRLENRNNQNASLHFSKITRVDY